MAENFKRREILRSVYGKFFRGGVLRLYLFDLVSRKLIMALEKSGIRRVVHIVVILLGLEE
jgi:hypothetical protein